LGQVELPIANDQLDPQAGIAFVKEIDQGRALEAIRQDRSASYANGAGEAFVARGEAALESRDRRLYGFGGGAQFSAKLGEPIAAKVSLHEPQR
jgi:hypothetical protein